MEIKKINENLINNKVLEDYSNHFNLNKKIIEILFNRGYNTKDKINSFLNDDINNLKDPFLLINMKEAIARIEKAITNNEKILIFGDYDVDGIGASSILYNYLTTRTKFVEVYLPNRLEDGYGLSCPQIDKIAEKIKPNLIITVDCGISCYNEVEYIKNMGIDIIVTDHHELPNKLPNCLIINTKFDQAFNFKGLCGAGISFKIVQALCMNNKENFERFLPICAISTIADIVPLVDENRIIVKEGLKRLNLLPLGVKILLKNNFKNFNISSTDIAFKIAPIINSSGRLDNAKISLNLFISKDLKLINESLKKLEELNNKRKNLCENIYKDCEELLKNENKNNKAIVLYKENWDIGVLGIVSARICENYNKPTILFGKNNGELKGSGRSVGNIDIFDLFNNVKEVLLNFGGHTKAGGLSLLEKNFKKFKNLTENYLTNKYTENDYLTYKYYDLEVEKDEITLEFVNELQILEPFGFENNNPVIKSVFDDFKITRLKNLPQHLNLKIKDKFEIIAFNEDKNYENYLNFNEKTILLELQKNNYSKNSIKGILKYVSFNKPNLILQEKLKASLLSQFNYFNDNFKTTFKQYTSLNQLSNIIDNKTLFLTYNINFNLKDSFCCSFNLNNKSNLKTLCYGLNSFENLERFDKIILIEYPINEEFIYNLRKFSQVYVPLNKSEKLNLVTDRTDFLDVYFALQKSIAKNYNTNNLYDYYLMLKRNFDIKFDYAMFYISLEIFKELNLIEEKLINNNLSFKFNKIKTELENSKIYNKIINYRS